MAVFCRFILLAPDLLRADSQENIYLEANGVSKPITVSISIQDFRKSTQLLQDSVTLSEENGFHTLKTIQVTVDSETEVKSVVIILYNVNEWVIQNSSLNVVSSSHPYNHLAHIRTFSS